MGKELSSLQRYLIIMAGSALLGHKPNIQDDAWIVNGFYRLGCIPDAAWNETSVIPIKTPPCAPHDSRKLGLIVSLAVVIALMTLIIGTRLSLRLFGRDLRWGLDDWAIIAGFLGAVAWVARALAAAVYAGAGRHLYALTYAEYNTHLTLMWVGQTLFYPVVAMIKISIVLFNRRLTVCYIIITIPINVSICVPSPKNLEPLYIGKMQTPPRRMKSEALVPAFSAIHVVFDFALLSVCYDPVVWQSTGVWVDLVERSVKEGIGRLRARLVWYNRIVFSI